MNIVKGRILPLNENILVTDMSFDEQKTSSGIILRSDDGKAHGVKPRWCRVWAIGPNQKDVKVGEWVLVEHGRWTRGVTVEDQDGKECIIRRVDPEAILVQADARPSDVYIGAEFDTAPPVTSRPEDFM